MSLYKCMGSKSKVTSLDLGIYKTQVGPIVQSLSISLASTYILALKIQSLHWNIVGPQFYSLHKLSEHLYQQLLVINDELAERIRALGHPAPASFAQYLKLSHVEEFSETLDAEMMVKSLLADFEELARFLKAAHELAEKGKDYASCELFAKHIGVHEESAWMLRSTVS